MIFNSFGFIFVYLPIVLSVFFLVGRFSQLFASVWLVAASLFFYGYWSITYLPLMLGSIVLNYIFGLYISVTTDKRRKWGLIFAVTINLLVLGYFKYADFFIGATNQIAGSHIPALNIILPIGISFFTFTQIAFLVDAYHGKVQERNFIYYVLFVSYFPHLVAGPVLHHKEMMPQFANAKNYRLSMKNIAIGSSIFIIGLAKKVLIADNLSPLVAPVFDASVHPQLIQTWVGVLAYTFQLYFDFSGYSDMAIGLSRLFGVKLPLNFNSPYKSLNIAIFWRRWHMTLSRFLRDYLYIPLGGNRGGGIKRHRNLLVTMLLGGLWHGAGWTFIVWGGLHGIYLVINHVWQSFSKTINFQPRSIVWKLCSWFITFMAVVFAWIFFRAHDMASALKVFKGLFGGNGVSLPRGLEAFEGWFHLLKIHPEFNGLQINNNMSLFALFFAAFIAFLLPNTQEIFSRYKPCYERISLYKKPKILWSPSFIWVGGLSILFSVAIFGINKATEFLYFQF